MKDKTNKITSTTEVKRGKADVMDKKTANEIYEKHKRGIKHNYTKQQISKARKVLRR